MPTCEPSAASLAVTGYAPTVSTPVVCTPTAAALALTAATPAVTTTVTADILAATQQSIGVKLEMDLDGLGLAEIPLFDGTNSEGVAAELEIEESLDNIGGDRLSLSLIGASYSPFSSDALRGKRDVSLTGYHARPGEVLTYADVFNGFIFGNEFQAFPPISRLTILDDAQQYNNPLVYELAPGHGLTRAQVVTAVCALAPAISTGTITLGARGAVALQKPVSEGGTRGRLDFLADYLAPCGVRIFFSGGNLQILPHDSSPPSVRTITADMICPDGASIQIPDYSRATKVTVTSTDYSVTAPGSTRTETETETVTALYAPLGSVLRQNADGSTESWTGGLAEESREVYKRITERTYDGGTLTAETVTIYQWYARKAAHRTYSWDGNGDPITDGTYGTPAATVLYQYADGEWYYDEHELYVITSKSVKTRSFDDDDYLATEIEEKYFYHFIRTPVLWVEDSNGTIGPVFGTISLLDSDEGVTEIREQIGLSTDRNAVDERTTIRYTRSANGQLFKVESTNEAFGIPRRKESNSMGAYIFGLRARIFAKTGDEALGNLLTVTTETYKQTAQNKYTATKSLSIKGAAPAAAGDYTEPITVEERVGTAPYCEKKENYEESAAVTGSATDTVRDGINGTVELFVDNQWCESAADCTALAEVLRRDESAVPVTIEIPFCWDLHKNDWITINVPSIGISNVKMFLYGIVRDVSNYRCRLSLLWYPAEII